MGSGVWLGGRQLLVVGAFHVAQAGEGRVRNDVPPLPGGGDNLFRRLLQPAEVAIAAAVLDHELEAARRAEACHRRRAEDRHDRLGNILRHLLLQLGRDAVAIEGRVVALVEVLKGDEDVAEVGAVGAERERLAGHPQRMRDALCVPGDLADEIADGLRPLQRGRVGELDGGIEPALVLQGDVAGRQLPRGPPRQEQQPAVHHQHDHAAAQRQADDARVKAGCAAEGPVEHAKEPAEQQVERPADDVLAGVAPQQQQGRQRRAERQRVEGRQHGRDGDGQRELPEEHAGDAADEGARHEHRRQHQRHGQHRAGHFLHRLDRRGARVHPLLDVVLHGLDDDNGVIDDNSDRQNQAEQRQVVEAEADGAHGRRRRCR